MPRGKDSDSTGSIMIESRHRRAKLYIFFVFSILFILVNGMLSRRLGGGVVNIGHMVIPSSGISGCVQALSVACCFFMVMIDYKRGIKLALFALAFSMFGNLRSIMMSHSLASIPGLINCIIYGVLAIIICGQFKASDRMAITDPVTELPNRHGFERALENRLRANQKGYVAYIHVGGFHELNANLGRRYGNQILKIVTERILSMVGKSGELFKIEGAEFALILSEECSYEALLSQIIDTIEESIEVDKNNVPVNCYVTGRAGVSDFFEKKTTAEEVMLCTDIAMNCAVNNEDMRICTYNDALKQQMARVTEIENLIKEGLENDYFYLQYQPQFILDGKQLRGFEALVRMKLPDGSVVSPAEFIPVAEKSDLIMDIDKYVRRRALTEFKEVCLRAGEGFALSVNVSAKEIESQGFPDEIFSLIDEIGFPANCLEIEITEYSFAQSLETTINNIRELRERGIKIAVDDFGTGYTSLAQLLNLPVTLLKIDKSLIDNIEESEMNRDFVKTVIYMGHLMNCEVISEGVEEESQLRLLNQYDCDFIQGFVWSRPLEYDAALGLCG